MRRSQLASSTRFELNYKFEGKERDSETGNDDFGARYYTSRFGRWLSADWSSVPVAVPYANLTNPQTLNLYAMVSDDPESFGRVAERRVGDP
jgi:RHS repeat-associated protein